MTVQTLMRYLSTAGVHLWTEGDSLKLDAPVGFVTPELKATLSAHKAELLAALASRRGICPHCHEPANLQYRATDFWFCPGCRLWMHGDGSPLPKTETTRPITLEQQEAEQLAADLSEAGCSFVRDKFDGSWNVRPRVRIVADLLVRFGLADRTELQRAIGELAELDNAKGWEN